MTGPASRGGSAFGLLVVSAVATWLVLGIDAEAVPSGWTDLSAWMRDRPPEVVALTVARTVALGLLAYLLSVTTATLAGSLSGSRIVTAVARRLTLPVLRRLLIVTTGLGVGTAAVVPVAPAGALIGRVDEPAGAEEPEIDTTSDRPPGAMSDDLLTLTRLDPPSTTDPPPTPRRGPAPEQPADHWLVAPGDHLWSIAESTVAESSPDGETSAPTDAEVAAYWRALIELNRDGLVDPDNPDLIVPGQRILLPPRPLGRG